MGYVGTIGFRMAFIDYLIVFVIFLAVRSAPQQNTLSKRWRRTGTCRSDIRSGICIVSLVTIHSCHTRSCFSNTGAVTYSTPFHEQVSDVFDWEIQFDTRITEADPSCMIVVR